MSLLYLTDIEKRSHLNFLRQRIEANDVDVELIPWLKKINKLPGVCTTQSCSGHKKGKYQDDGHIRFRLSESMMDVFLQILPAMYRHRGGIEFVDVRYHPVQKAWDWLPNTNDEDFCPEVMIDFLGLNRSPKHLESFISHLLGILQQCAARLMMKEKK